MLSIGCLFSFEFNIFLGFGTRGPRSVVSQFRLWESDEVTVGSPTAFVLSP